MTCRHCGIEIADKALICYRCGTATAEPSLRPRPAPRASTRRLPALIGLVVLLIAGLYMGRAATSGVPPAVGWILAALAAILLVWRLTIRR
jgi:hypothetical protein